MQVRHRLRHHRVKQSLHDTVIGRSGWLGQRTRWHSTGVLFEHWSNRHFQCYGTSHIFPCAIDGVSNRFVCVLLCYFIRQIVDDGDAGVIEMGDALATLAEPSSWKLSTTPLTSITITVRRNLGDHRLQRKCCVGDSLYNPDSVNNVYGNLSVLYTTYNGTAKGNIEVDQPYTLFSGVDIVQEIGDKDFQSTVSGMVSFPQEGENEQGCSDSLCQEITVALFSDREYESPDETFTVTLHDLSYNGQAIPEAVLAADSATTTVTIEDDGDLATISWCEYTCTTNACPDDAALDKARTTPKCDAFSKTAPWPQSPTTGRELKICGASGNLQCNKLPDGVSYYYQVNEGTDFTVAFKRWGSSGFDEQRKW